MAAFYATNLWSLRVLSLVMGSVLLAGCGGQPSGQAQTPLPKVTVTEAVEQETIDYDQYVGRTEASETVEVRSRVYGYLKTVAFDDGDHVASDQPLFMIEPDEYQAIHQQSLAKITVWESKLALAKSKLARDEKLIGSGAISREEYDESLAAVQEAEASVVAAKVDAERTALDLKYTVLRAPISGRIDRALVTPGNLLTGGSTQGTMLTRIVKVEPIHVYFDVDERSLLRYQRLGRDAADASVQKTVREQEIPCYLQLADETDFPHVGNLDFVENRIDPATGTIKIRGVFANRDRRLMPGLFVNVRVPVSGRYRALMIPERALATDQGEKCVYVVDSDNLVTRRTVTLGAQRGPLRIIQSGLKPSERVIIKGLQRVRPQQEVEAVFEPTLSIDQPATPSASQAATGEPSESPGSVSAVEGVAKPKAGAAEKPPAAKAKPDSPAKPPASAQPASPTP